MKQEHHTANNSHDVTAQSHPHVTTVFVTQRRPSGVSRTRNQSCSHFRSADSAHRLLAVPDGYPDITTSPMLKAVELGRPAQMQCEATGTPKPEINWLKDYIPVELTDPRLSLLDSGEFISHPLPLPV